MNSKKKMNLENEFRKYFEKQGYTVLHKGWPDFLCYKGDDVVVVECKQGADTVKDHQKQMHIALAKCGIRVRVVREDFCPVSTFVEEFDSFNEWCKFHRIGPEYNRDFDGLGVS